MKSSVTPRFLLTVCAAVILTHTLPAQDVVFQKDKVERKGQILGISGDRIKIKIGPAETSISLNLVDTVTMEAPKKYDQILETWQTGDAQKTLAALQPFVDNFRGLPTPWAERASALLGEVYLSLDKVPEAEKAFDAFLKAYPDAGAIADIGLARLAVTKKDFSSAKAKIEPILTEAAGVTVTGPAQSAAYGQAYYLMGVIRESEGTLPEALQDYLTTVTVFSEDKAVVAKARERADLLIEKQVIVP